MKVIYEYQPILKERIKHLAEYLLNKLPLAIGMIQMTQGYWYGLIFVLIGVLEFDFHVKKGKQMILFKWCEK